MVAPVRIQLRRTKGFRLRDHSLAINGLPARKVTRPGLFGNPFAVTPRTTPERAVKAFRGFLRTWTDKAIFEGVKFEDDMSPAVMAGLGMIVLRNRIRANLHHLRSYNLACFCKDGQACHVAVYLDLLATDWPERWKAKYPRICEEVR